VNVITRVILRLYPKRWRQRYETEIEDVITQSGSSWRVLADVLRSAAVMRLREVRSVPAFTLAAVGTLAIAIGANVMIFSVVNAVLLKPLPFPAPHELVGVWHVAPGFMRGPVNQAAFTYFTYRDDATSFEEIGLWSRASAVVVGRGDPEELPSLNVTDGTLSLLRVRPVAGRSFTAADDMPGSRETVMISHDYWLRAFQGSPNAIGQTLIVDGRAREVIGVLPPRFRFLQLSPTLVLPLRLNREQTQIGLFRYQGVARLKPGVSIEQAHADLARLIPGMPDRFPIPRGFSRQMYDDFGLAPEIHPWREDLAGDVSGMLWIVFGAVGLLLLVACANVANLYLIRGESRRQELAIRIALGASRRRVAAQLLCESIILAVAGGVIGLFVAAVGLDVLRAVEPGRLPLLDDAAIDPYAMVFALALSLFAGAIFSVLPIRRFTRPVLAQSLKENGRGTSDGRERHRVRTFLVAAQVAIALVLLIGSALMLQTFAAIRDVEPGYVDGGSLLTMRLTISESTVSGPAAAALLHEQISSRLAGVAGIRSVGLTSSVTMDGANRRDPVFAEGLIGEDGNWPAVRRMKWVSPSYFTTMGIPLVAGRDYTWDDVRNRRPFAIISESLAREVYGGAENAIGRRLRASPTSPWREIVGVTGNERDDGPAAGPTPIVYWPFLQENHAPNRVTVEWTMVYVMRTSRLGDPALLGDLQQAVWSVNPSLPISRVETVQDVYDRVTSQTSFMMLALLVSSAVTLLLGVVGIYGVIAYVVVQRRREVGIRMALGAGGADIMRMFLVWGSSTVLAGLVAGVAGAAAASQAISGMLFGVSAIDPLTYVLAIAIVGAIATLAIWIPARAATRIAPTSALS
jgi:putative ABC transport system permease protein